MDNLMTGIGISMILMALPYMVRHYHQKAVKESFKASVERLKNDPEALKAFTESRWDGK